MAEKHDKNELKITATTTKQGRLKKQAYLPVDRDITEELCNIYKHA